jgi:hypothetical protein
LLGGRRHLCYSDCPLGFLHRLLLKQAALQELLQLTSRRRQLAAQGRVLRHKGLQLNSSCLCCRMCRCMLPPSVCNHSGHAAKRVLLLLLLLLQRLLAVLSRYKTLLCCFELLLAYAAALAGDLLLHEGCFLLLQPLKLLLQSKQLGRHLSCLLLPSRSSCQYITSLSMQLAQHCRGFRLQACLRLCRSRCPLRRRSCQLVRLLLQAACLLLSLSQRRAGVSEGIPPTDQASSSSSTGCGHNQAAETCLWQHLAVAGQPKSHLVLSCTLLASLARVHTSRSTSFASSCLKARSDACRTVAWHGGKLNWQHGKRHPSNMVQRLCMV